MERQRVEKQEQEDLCRHLMEKVARLEATVRSMESQGLRPETETSDANEVREFSCCTLI